MLEIEASTYANLVEKLQTELNNLQQQTGNFPGFFVPVKDAEDPLDLEEKSELE